MSKPIVIFKTKRGYNVTIKRNEPKYKFAEMVRELRASRGYTPKDVEDNCGIAKGYLWMVENEKRGIPTLEQIMKLEKGLKCSSGYLVNKAVKFIQEATDGGKTNEE